MEKRKIESSVRGLRGNRCPAVSAGLAIVTMLFVQSCGTLGIGGNEESASSTNVREERLATFKNATTSTLKVTFHLFRRSDASSGEGSVVLRTQAMYVAAGGEQNFIARDISGTGINLISPVNRVLRIKVETLGPSWESAPPTWIEILAPLPASVRASGEREALAFSVAGGEVVKVPRNLWPAE